jgi:hypothetical protein
LFDQVDFIYQLGTWNNKKHFDATVARSLGLGRIEIPQYEKFGNVLFDLHDVPIVTTGDRDPYHLAMASPAVAAEVPTKPLATKDEVHYVR